MNGRALGGLTALAVVIVDQASKFWLLHGLGMKDHERIAVTPFLNFELLWNPGISFSLFPQDTTAGRWILLALMLAATGLLVAWLLRVRSRLAGFALGAIVGGALGNGYDRFTYNAVADFLDFHAWGRHPFVFNVADAAITIGAALLLYDGLAIGRRALPPQQAGG